MNCAILSGAKIRRDRLLLMLLTARYLRQMLVVGALAVVKYAQRHGTRRPWLVKLLARRPTKVATVALAYKIARMSWAIMMTGEDYREPELRAASKPAPRRLGSLGRSI
jgi:hypothetical protein